MTQYDCAAMPAYLAKKIKWGTNYLVTRPNDVNEHTHTSIDNVDDPHSEEFHWSIFFLLYSCCVILRDKWLDGSVSSKIVSACILR